MTNDKKQKQRNLFSFTSDKNISFNSTNDRSAFLLKTKVFRAHYTLFMCTFDALKVSKQMKTQSKKGK